MATEFDIFNEIKRDDLLEGIFQQLNDGLLVVDRNGNILYSNAAANDLFAAVANPLNGHLFGIPTVNKTIEMSIPAAHSTWDVELKASEIQLNRGEGYIIIVRQINDNQ